VNKKSIALQINSLLLHPDNLKDMNKVLGNSYPLKNQHFFLSYKDMATALAVFFLSFSKILSPK